MNIGRPLALVLVCVFSFAQQPASDTLKLKAGATLVLVPVVVTDADGQPVFDLRQEEFEVFEAGKRQTIVSFEPPVRRQPTRASAPPASRTEFSNFDGPPGRRLAIIAIDAQNTSTYNQPYARDAVTRFLAKASETADRIAVIVLQNGGFRVIHDFSVDSDWLRRAIDSVRLRSNLAPLQGEGPPMQTGGGGDAASAAIEEVLRNMEQKAEQLQSDINEHSTAESMKAVAQTYGPLPGRKTLIWVSDAFSRRKDAPVLAGVRVSADSGRGTDTILFDSVFRDLNAASIAVYPVDARGLVAFAPSGGLDLGHGIHSGPGPMSSIDAQIETMSWFAHETGGKASFNRNDISTSIDRALADSDATYLLSFRLAPGARKGWHSLAVKVNRPRVKFSARKGFYATQSGSDDDAQQLEEALRSPLPWTGLPLMARWLPPQPGSGTKKLVALQIAVPPGELAIDQSDGNHMSVDVRALATRDDMKPAGQFSKTVDARLKPESLASVHKGGFSYTGKMELEPGRYSVNIVVRDRISGRIGTIPAYLQLD